MPARNRHREPQLIEYLQGLHITNSVLWLDAPRRADLCFISHAHLAGIDQHKKVLATEPTLKLAQALWSSRLPPDSKLSCPFYRRFSLGGMDLELHPAGHILGSAQLIVHHEGRCLVYTGHFNLEDSRTAEQARIHPCDILVLDATGADAGLLLPTRSLVEKDLLSWIESNLHADRQPVLVCQPLGAAQELLHLLNEHQLNPCVHRNIHRINQVYRQFGVDIGKAGRLSGHPAPGQVLLWPFQIPIDRILPKLPTARLAIIESKPVPSSESEPDLERFNLSTHSDLSMRVRYAKESGAKQIFVVNGPAERLASDLRASGLNAWPLVPPRQLDLFNSERRQAGEARSTMESFRE